ncbi:hypothetical protein T03_2487 [Trichinella britovi]|uniref:Uncharacterized protein n=1 Tax=Trichinella britovi TaxID=45882 RepID=A0A0V1CSG4_TRIBR|nr:hypothetical protein T03_2487 [Trichinella britovi]
MKVHINLHPVKLELKLIQSICSMQFLKIPSWQNSVGYNSRLKQLISYWTLLAQLKQCEQASATANRDSQSGFGVVKSDNWPPKNNGLRGVDASG